MKSLLILNMASLRNSPRVVVAPAMPYGVNPSDKNGFPLVNIKGTERSLKLLINRMTEKLSSVDLVSGDSK